MGLWPGILSWLKCHWPNLNSAGSFRRNLFLKLLKPQHSNPNPTPNPLANQLWCITTLLPHTSSITDSLPSLNLLCYSKTDARFMQDGPKAVWSIPYVSVVCFPSLKQNFIAYHYSKVHIAFLIFTSQLWQSVFRRVYSNSCCSCSFVL